MFHDVLGDNKTMDYLQVVNSRKSQEILGNPRNFLDFQIFLEDLRNYCFYFQFGYSRI